MTLIDLLDDSCINTLVPALSLRPDHLVFFYDKRWHSPSQLKHLKEMFVSRLPKTQLTFVDADKNSYKDIYAKMSEAANTIAARVPDEHIYIDLTGGDALMAVSGMELSHDHNVHLIHANVKKGEIIEVITEAAIAPAVSLTLHDVLATKGARHLKNSHLYPNPSDFGRISLAAEFLFEHLDSWHRLHQYIVSHLTGADRMSFPAPQDTELHPLLDVFVAQGFLSEDASALCYRFSHEQAKSYVSTYGIWLELYLYIKLKESFDEVWLGVVIDWDSSDGNSVDNEIDVALIKDSVPVFISCKMTKPKPEDVYEVFGLAKRMDASARAMLATTFPNDAANKNGVYQRAKKMKVGFIETSDFLATASSQVFNAAWKMTDQ